MNTLTTPPPQLDLMPSNADNNTAHRIKKFTTWLDNTGRNWTAPDLADYRDDLLQNYAPSTVISSIASMVSGSRSSISRATRLATPEAASACTCPRSVFG